jgi:hypothetical protein
VQLAWLLAGCDARPAGSPAEDLSQWQGTYGASLKGIHGIGADALTVCYELTGERYPASFDASRGSRQVLYEFRRE